MIHLSRTVEVQTYDAQAILSLGRTRPELLAVARLAADAGRPITGADVARELLGGVPNHVGKLVIDRCAHVGLLTWLPSRDATLTQHGAFALAHGEVLVPEEAVYRFYFADDPLLPSPLLHVRALRQPSAYDARTQLREARERRERIEADPVPRLLTNVPRDQVQISAVQRSPFAVVHAPTAGRRGPGGTLRFDLRWSPGERPRLLLTGALPGATPNESELTVDASVDAVPELVELGYDAVWRGLVAAATGHSEATLRAWQERYERPVVPVAFDKLPEATRRSFVHPLSVPPWRHPALGAFQAAELPGVEVVPASDADAQAWCHWLQWDAATGGYSTPALLEAAAHAARARFPHRSPRPLTPDEMLAAALSSRSERRPWTLLAPSDLGLWSRS